MHTVRRPAPRRAARSRLTAVLTTVVLLPLSVLLAPAPAGAAGGAGAGFTVTAGDLRFILRQVRIAERHASTLSASDPCGTLVGSGPNQVPDRLTSYGLRTVDGSCNNLFADRGRWAAADEPFTRLAPVQHRAAEGVAAGAIHPGSPARAASSYAQTRGAVYDAQPRVISNLVVDQTALNPAAVAAAGTPVRTQGNRGVTPCQAGGDPDVDDPDGTPDGCVPEGGTLFIPNVTTDVGLSPPYNSLFTYFGQFFDHGIDQTVKGGGTVYVPLAADDPLRSLGADGRPGTGDELGDGPQFMAMTRARNQPGPDGVAGDDPATSRDESVDDVREADNTDSPLVDQSQTYASHASHQVFLREYDRAAPGPDGVLHDNPSTPVDESKDNTGDPVSTGYLLGGLPAGRTYPGSPDGRDGMATWAAAKQQAAEELGLLLTDADALDVPALLTDPYGQFVPGPHGLPQYLRADGTTLEGDLDDPVAPPADVVHFQTPFLTDIAHAADPSPQDVDHDPTTAPVVPVADADTEPGRPNDQPAPGEYDDELLAAHFVAGDGRVNENIALSFIHQVFHSEHDRVAANIDATLHAAGNESLLAGFTTTTAPEGTPAGARAWSYGDRLFQAARFVTEMEYQHLVFEEFARKMVPTVHPFTVYSPDRNPAIDAEFAHAVYRFGHSMLDDVVARRLGTTDHDLLLLDAFLDPTAYQDSGDAQDPWTPREAAGALAMGSADQVGNEIDEFMTSTLRSNLLGLPLDLAALNIARGRDTGVPRLNELRRAVSQPTGEASLIPYASWVDLGNHLRHPETLVNLVAAYGTHPTIVAATTLAERREAARVIVDPRPGDTVPPDAPAFLFSIPGHDLSACAEPDAECRDWSPDATGRSVSGLEDVDLWVGGLAEDTAPFGGLLGSTFGYVFQTQMERLQDHDRFYYLARTAGLNLRSELEANSFSELVRRNTSGTTGLKADAFGTADCTFDLEALAGTAAGFQAAGSTVADTPATPCDELALLQRQPDGTITYRSRNSIDPPGINAQAVYEGTTGVDRISGGNDNDTFWGDAGDDRIEGNAGDDVVLGGLGDDRMSDANGLDVLKGGAGDDVAAAGPGDDLLLGGTGQDVLDGGLNDNESFGGEGSDFIIAGTGADVAFGGGAGDWIEGGTGQDLLIGDHGAPFFDDPGEALPGDDVMVGQAGENDYDAEGGDDLMAQNAAVDRNAGAGGFDWAFHQYDTVAADDDLMINRVTADLPLPVVVNRDRWQEVEGVSGSALDDVIRGDDARPASVGGGGLSGCNALDAAGLRRVPGLAEVVPPLDAPDTAGSDLGLPSGTRLTADDLAARSVTGSCPLEGDVWGDGNILLGGGGSDLLEGRGGDDVIDGDRELTVRIAVVVDGGELGSTDLLEHTALRGTFGSGATGMTLQRALTEGRVDPGSLQIVREVVLPAGSGAVDTAVFSGDRSDYVVDALPTGELVVSDTRTAGRTDGTDTLRNVERLRFADQVVGLDPPDSPTDVAAQAGDASLTVSWREAVAQPLLPVSEYAVQVYVGGVLDWTVEGLPGSATSAVVTGLANGTTYSVRVVAVNAVGRSAPSAQSAAATPLAPPRIVRTTPAQDATGVAVATVPQVVFDQPVTGASRESVALYNPATGVQVATSLTPSADGTTLDVRPTAPLPAGTRLVLRLRGRLTDGRPGLRSLAGAPITDTTVSFTTAGGDTVAPLVTATAPATGATGVARTALVRFDTSERVVGVSGTSFVLRPWRSNGTLGTAVAGRITTNAAGTRWILDPTASLAARTRFQVALGCGTSIRDAAGNALTSRTPSGCTWSFTTR